MSKSEAEVKTYELSYLFSPLIPAEEVVALVASGPKEAILAAGGMVEREIDPRMSKLSFPVSRSIEHKRSVYKEAYFGTIAFKIEAGELHLLEEKLRLLPNLIRYSVIAVPKNSFQIPAFKKPLSAHKPAAKIVKPVAEGSLTKEQIDKEIEGLLAPAA